MNALCRGDANSHVNGHGEEEPGLNSPHSGAHFWRKSKVVTMRQGLEEK